MVAGAVFEQHRVRHAMTAPGTDSAVNHDNSQALHLPEPVGNVVAYPVNSPERPWEKGAAPAGNTGYLAWGPASAPPGEWDEPPAAPDAAWVTPPDGQED